MIQPRVCLQVGGGLPLPRGKVAFPPTANPLPSRMPVTQPAKSKSFQTGARIPIYYEQIQEEPTRS